VSNLLFLAVAVVVSALGSLVLLLRHRRPQSMQATMRDFERQIRALSPEADADADETSADRRGQSAG